MQQKTKLEADRDAFMEQKKPSEFTPEDRYFWVEYFKVFIKNNYPDRAAEYADKALQEQKKRF